MNCFTSILMSKKTLSKRFFRRGNSTGPYLCPRTGAFKKNALYVLDYERAGEVIRTAGHIGISLWYCRYKMAHLGRDCDAPQNICMTFNTAAGSLIKHGFARRTGVSECLDLLHAAYENNLVQFGENVQEGVYFICNCGGCCEAMLTIRRTSGVANKPKEGAWMTA